MNLLKAEFRKIFIETKTYYPDFIVGIFTDFVLFVLVINSNEDRSVKVLGYVLWLLASGVLSESSINISTEKQLGTLQNLLIKPYSILEIIIAKSLAWFSVNIVKSALIVAILGCFIDLSNAFHPSFLLVVFLVCVGIMGFSLMLSALTLIYTKIASFVLVISYLLLFLSGSVVPVPPILAYTNPLSYGIMFSSLISLGQASFINLLYQIFISVVWLTAGVVVFKFVFSRSKQFKWTY